MYGWGIGNNVIPLKRAGNCLFRAVSYCMYNTEDRYSEINLKTVNEIINDWNIVNILSCVYQ